MNFQNGDFILDTSGKAAEVADMDENGKLEVWYIVPDASRANGKIYHYQENWVTIDPSMVQQHFPKPDKAKVLETYRQLGFRPMTEDIFVRADVDIEADDDLKHFQFPTDTIDVDDYESETDSLDGFIVPDEDGEAFVPASPTNDFVIDTHRAVRDYNNWVPDSSNKQQVGIKNFIDHMEAKYTSMEDDRQFMAGQSIDYNHPPLQGVKSTGK